MPRAQSKKVATKQGRKALNQRKKEKAQESSKTRQRKTKTDEVANSTPTMTYEIWKGMIPPDPTVRIVFHGLLCFFFDGKSRCEVGIHNATQGLSRPHHHPHEFNISVWTKRNGCPPAPMRFPIGNPKNIGDVRIDVINPRELGGVYVYERPPIGTSNFDRLSSQNDPKDWRWVLDFESEILYPKGVPKKPQTINPCIYINNGLFYTLHKTTSTFKLHASEGSERDRDIGSVAELVAANIYIGLGGQVILTIPPIPVPIPLIGGIGLTYQIDITNNCRQGSGGCEFHPSPDYPKEDRNDFYLYYDTFELPDRKPEYELILAESRAPQDDFDICLEEHKGRVIVSNNEAPCGAAGYGQSRSGSGG